MAAYFVIFLLVFFVVFLVPVALLLGTVLTGLIAICSIRHEPPPPHNPSDIYFPPKRKYKTWSARHSWPRASGLFYKCDICHKSLPSETTVARECGCGNLFVGPEHIGAQNSMEVQLYEE